MWTRVDASWSACPPDERMRTVAPCAGGLLPPAFSSLANGRDGVGLTGRCTATRDGHIFGSGTARDSGAILWFPRRPGRVSLKSLGTAMTFLILAALLAATASTSAPPIDFRAERITLVKSVHPVVVPDATLESRPDSDPNTVQFFVVAGIPVNSGHISQDGQAIYVPASAMSGPEANDTIGAKLFALALDRLLSLKIGSACPPIQVPASST
jgi:hypothetical protein